MLTRMPELRNLAPVDAIPHMGGCQNYSPFLGTLNTRCRKGSKKGTIILTTTHIPLYEPESKLLEGGLYRFFALETTTGDNKGDTRSLDSSSYACSQRPDQILRHPKEGFQWFRKRVVRRRSVQEVLRSTISGLYYSPPTYKCESTRVCSCT